MRSHPEISGVRVAQSLAFYVVFCNKLKNKISHAVLKSKSRDKLTRSEDHVSEWVYISIRGLF